MGHKRLRWKDGHNFVIKSVLLSSVVCPMTSLGVIFVRGLKIVNVYVEEIFYLGWDVIYVD